MGNIARFPLEMQPARPYPPSDPREQAVLPKYEPPTADDWARMEALEMIRLIGERYGYARVSTWVRNLAAIHGESI